MFYEYKTRYDFQWVKLVYRELTMCFKNVNYLSPIGENLRMEKVLAYIAC